MKYLSMFSGIEAATVAWEPLGFEPVAFCEVDPFASAVIAHHFPETPNLGDVQEADFDAIGPVDLAVFGSPCQSYSVAGKRLGLDDPRGNLALVAGQAVYRKRPRWFVFENVPGLLSSDNGWDFGTLLAAFAGYKPGAVFEPPADGWNSSGIVVEAEGGYGLAWRVLDAQYFGLAQRRKRVFVVGHLGDWRRAAAVLFERESLSRNPPPRREAREATPSTATDSTNGSCAVSGCDRAARKRGWCNTHYQRWRKHGFVANTPVNEPGRSDAERFWAKVTKSDQCWEWNAALNENGYGIFWSNDEARTVRAHRFSYEQANGEIPDGFELDHLCRNRGCVRPDHLEPVTGAENSRRGNAGKHWAEKRGEAIPEVAPTISARPTGGGGLGTDCDGGLIAFGGNNTAGPIDLAAGINTKCGGRYDFQSETLVAFNARMDPVHGDIRGALDRDGGTQAIAFAVATGYAVRRLTPREAERLQGFPRGFTRIPYRGKPASECPDGNRYKALGNSFAVPVVRWIGERIAAVDAIQARESAA